MVDFYTLKPSIKAKRKRTCKPKGKDGSQQLLAEAAGEAMAPAVPTTPIRVQTPTIASTPLPPSISPDITSPPSPDTASIKEEDVELYLGAPSHTAPSFLSTPCSFPPPPSNPSCLLSKLQPCGRMTPACQLKMLRGSPPHQGQHKFIAVPGNLQEQAVANKKLNDQHGHIAQGPNALVPMRHMFPFYIILCLLL